MEIEAQINYYKETEIFYQTEAAYVTNAQEKTTQIAPNQDGKWQLSLLTRK